MGLGIGLRDRIRNRTRDMIRRYGNTFMNRNVIRIRNKSIKNRKGELGLEIR